MSDYERYMDYNGVHDDDDQLHPPAPWAVFFKKLCRWLFIAVAVGVIAIFAIRFAVAEWYPKMAKQLYLTDPLAAEYGASGELTVLTQEMLVPVEDRADGFYRADNLLVIRQTGSIQCSLRVNRHALDDMAERYGLSGADRVMDALSFTLYYKDAEGTVYSYGTAHVERDSHLWYEYVKICFDSVELENIPWYRLNIHVEGVADTEEEPTACIGIYQNNADYNRFDPYRPSREELEP